MLLFDFTLQSISTDLISSVIAAITTVVTAYIIIRERVIKNEIKTENIYDYIDSRNELLENKIKELQIDIIEFKEVNKETAKSLTENTAAIRELKFVLDILREKLVKP